MKYRVLVSVLVGWGAFGILVNEASAIPTFARKYRTSCLTCHTAVPKLNTFGEVFRKNGYEIPGGPEAVYVKEKPVYLGAEAWKRIWPDAVWPGAIPSNVPVSFMAHNRIRFRENHPTSEADFNFPFEFKMLLGGTIGQHIPFFGEWVFVDDATEVNELGNLHLGFYDLFDGQLGADALNMKIGRMEIAAADGFRKRNRQFINPYLIGSYNVGSSGFNLSDNLSAIELDGIINHRFYWAVGATNGEGGMADVNDRKDLYHRLAYKLGGMAFDGTGGGGADEGLPSSGGWAETSLTLGTFGYLGRSRLGDAPDQFPNRFYRIGLDARLRYRDLDLFGAYVYGSDRNPSDAGAVDSNAWFAEADYPIYPWLWTGFRAEGVTLNNAKDQVRYIPNVTILPRANIRVIGEYVLNENEEDGGNQFVLDLLYIF